MTQAGKKSKSRKRHNSSWACTSLQPGPHTALSLPRPRVRSPARLGPGRAAPRSTGPRFRCRFLGMRPWRGPEGGCRVASAGRNRPGGPGKPEPHPRPGASRGAGGCRRSTVPFGRAVHACQAAAQGSPPLSPGRGNVKRAGTGRGGGDTHPWWRWRRYRLGPECHLRSRSCMPGAWAAGTAAGLAPRGRRGLRSGPPPPPQAPAPAPPAAGRCGMGRVGRYIPGAPRLGPARPWRRRSARPPASPSARQSLRPATVLHLRNAPKNKPLVAQLVPLPVTHRSARQSQAITGPSYHPYPPHQPIMRKSPPPLPTPTKPLPNTLSAAC